MFLYTYPRVLQPPAGQQMCKVVLDEFNIEYDFQEPVMVGEKGFVVDFLLKNKVVIEISSISQTPEFEKAAKERDNQLKNAGYFVIRIPYNYAICLDSLKKALQPLTTLPEMSCQNEKNTYAKSVFKDKDNLNF